MKQRSLLILLLCIAMGNLFAQTTLPNNAGKLPAPKNLKPLTKPDLVITDMSVVSIDGNGIDKDWEIRLSVTIKNAGGLAAPQTTFKAMAQNAAVTSNPWKNFGTAACPKINPGQTVTTEIRFVDKQWVMHKIPRFNLMLKADASNKVVESAEDNNNSKGILIGL